MWHRRFVARFYAYPFLVVFVITSSVSSADADKPDAQKSVPPELIEELAADKFETRQAAAKRLRGFGREAIIALDNAFQTHANAEVRAQAREVLKLLPGVKRSDNHLSTTLIWCPPGEYTMGPNSNELRTKRILEPVPTKVFFTRGFWLGQCEVTQKEWQVVMKTVPWKDSKHTTIGDNVAATYTSWKNAQEFCRRITDIERRAGRITESQAYSLPSEAQWEYACRAGTNASYFFDDNRYRAQERIKEYAWCDFTREEAELEKAREVGKKKPNPWGFYDTLGNVYELCQDYHFLPILPSGDDPMVSTHKDPPCFVARGGSCESSKPTCWERARAYGDGASRLTGIRIALVRPRAKDAASEPRAAPTPK